MASRPNLADAANVAASLGGGMAANDPRLAAAVRQASAAFRSRTRQIITAVSADQERHNGTPSPMLLLRQAPVTQIVSVVVDGVTLDASDYEVDMEGARLKRVSGGWDAPLGGIVVTYDHGYAADLSTGEEDGGVPEEIREAVSERAQMLFNSRAAIQTYTTGGESFTTRVGATQAWMDAVERFTLDRVRPH